MSGSNQGIFGNEGGNSIAAFRIPIKSVFIQAISGILYEALQLMEKIMDRNEKLLIYRDVNC